MKILCSEKCSVDRGKSKRANYGWEVIFANYIFDQGFATRSYKELLQLEPKY